MNKANFPKLSVVMAVYNGERFLREAVESILSQTYSDFEFIIFDDCSKDGSAAILRSFTDPRLRIHTNEKNIGLTNSLNKGLAVARGKYIARMDADDISLPTRFAKQVAFLNEYPAIALVGTWMECIDAEGRSLSSVNMPTDPQIIKDEMLKENCIAHPSVMFRKDAVLATGGYQTTLGRYAQDYDLWLRLLEQYQIANLSEHLLRYRMHSQQITYKNLPQQGKAAWKARRFAIKRRKKMGKSLPPGLDLIACWKSQFTGGAGSVGHCYLKLGWQYESMAEYRLARKAFLKAGLYSPLSRVALGKLRRILFEGMSIKNSLKVFKWFRHRLSLIQK